MKNQEQHPFFLSFAAAFLGLSTKESFLGSTNSLYASSSWYFENKALPTVLKN